MMMSSGTLEMAEREIGTEGVGGKMAAVQLDFGLMEKKKSERKKSDM